MCASGFNEIEYCTIIIEFPFWWFKLTLLSPLLGQESCHPPHDERSDPVHLGWYVNGSTRPQECTCELHDCILGLIVHVIQLPASTSLHNASGGGLDRLCGKYKHFLVIMEFLNPHSILIRDFHFTPLWWEMLDTSGTNWWICFVSVWYVMYVKHIRRPLGSAKVWEFAWF